MDMQISVKNYIKITDPLKCLNTWFDAKGSRRINIVLYNIGGETLILFVHAVIHNLKDLSCPLKVTDD